MREPKSTLDIVAILWMMSIDLFSKNKIYTYDALHYSQPSVYVSKWCVSDREKNESL